MSGLPSPEKVVDYWIGDARDDAELAKKRTRVWFGKSDKVDAYLAENFTQIIAELAAGRADDWAAQGPVGRLGAIIVLDQFTRNIFRGKRGAFENDFRALFLCKDGLMKGDDKELSEVERQFFYLPLEHSERIADQKLCVDLFERLLREARPAFRPLAEGALDYAHQHKAVIDRFGRFPHRNAILGRDNTPEEEAYLAQPGSGF